MGSGLLVWTLLGCGLIDSARDSVQDVKDKIAGLTNPLVTQSLVLGTI